MLTSILFLVIFLNQNHVRDLSVTPKVRRYVVKVKVVNSAGVVLDFESIKDADKQLKMDWRDDAIIAYGKDQLGKTSEFLFVQPKDNNQ